MREGFKDDMDFFKSFEIKENILLKAKEMPIGTVSKGYKKVAKGKWVKEKKEKYSSKELLKIVNKVIKEGIGFPKHGSSYARFRGGMMVAKQAAEKGDFKTVKDRLSGWGFNMSGNIIKKRKKEYRKGGGIYTGA